jgi:predicted MFS family arabinose efflux permease
VRPFLANVTQLGVSALSLVLLLMGLGGLLGTRIFRFLDGLPNGASWRRLGSLTTLVTRNVGPFS